MLVQVSVNPVSLSVVNVIFCSLANFNVSLIDLVLIIDLFITLTHHKRGYVWMWLHLRARCSHGKSHIWLVSHTFPTPDVQGEKDWTKLRTLWNSTKSSLIGIGIVSNLYEEKWLFCQLPT